MRSLRSQLVLICVLTILLFPIVTFSPLSLLRAIFAIPLIFFFPGYALLAALFPRSEDMNFTERVLLGCALSLSIEPLILLALNYFASLTLYPSLISITTFVIIVSWIAWWRQGKVGDKILKLSTHPLESTTSSSSRKTFPHTTGYRMGLWALFIALSAAVALFPVHITLDASPIQSLDIFASLPLFAGLFLIWMAILLVMLFSRKMGVRNHWEKLAIVCIFALVFVGFWNIITPYSMGGDSISNLGLVSYLQSVGKIPNPPFGYFTFPGVFLFTNVVSQFTKLDVFATGYFVILAIIVLFTALLYQFYMNLMKNSQAASAAILLTAIGGTLLRSEFRPDLLGYIFLAALLVILTRHENKAMRTSPEALMLIILIAACTITYLMHSSLFFFIIFGILLVQWLGKGKSLNILFVLLPLVTVLSWEMYMAVIQFNNIANFIPLMKEQLTNGGFLFTALQQQGGATGVAVPEWAVVLRYFRWVFFYGFGTILGFNTLAHFRKLDSMEKIMAGGFLGVGVVSIFLTILWPNGAEFNRYLMYAPIFLAPLIVKFCFQQRWQKFAITFFAILILLTSLPYFLIDGSSISVNAVSSAEISAGEFLHSKYGDGDDLTVYSNYSLGGDIAWYYAIKATFEGPPVYSEIKDANDLFSDEESLVEEFQNSGSNSVFIYSERRALGWDGTFGIPLNDPQWQNIKAQLAGENGENVLFSNEYIHIYAPPNATK